MGVVVDPKNITEKACAGLSREAVKLDRNQRLVPSTITIILSETDRVALAPILPFWKASLHTNLNATFANLNNPGTLLNRISARLPFLPQRVYLRASDRWQIEYAFDAEIKPGEAVVINAFPPPAAESAEGGRTVPFQQASATVPATVGSLARSAPAGWLRIMFIDRNGRQAVNVSGLMVRIGRDPSCDVSINDGEDKVSRIHLECRRNAGGEAEIRSVGMNRTLLDGTPLGESWTNLPTACSIDIAGFQLNLART